MIEGALMKHAPQRAASEPEGKAVKQSKKKSSKNAPGFNVPQIAYRYFKTDLFAISGISYGPVLCLLCEKKLPRPADDNGLQSAAPVLLRGNTAGCLLCKSQAGGTKVPTEAC